MVAPNTGSDLQGGLTRMVHLPNCSFGSNLIVLGHLYLPTLGPKGKNCTGEVEH